MTVSLSVENLYHVAWSEVAKRLPLPDLARLAACSSAMKALVDSPAVWTEQFTRRWQHPLPISSSDLHDHWLQVARDVEAGVVECWQNWALIVEDPLQAAGDLNPRERNGNTPLHALVLAHEYQKAAQLIDRGASTMIRNQEGKTPLHLLLQNIRQNWLPTTSKTKALLKKLLQNPRAAYMTDREGITPYQLAEGLRVRAMMPAPIVSEPIPAPSMTLENPKSVYRVYDRALYDREPVLVHNMECILRLTDNPDSALWSREFLTAHRTALSTRNATGMTLPICCWFEARDKFDMLVEAGVDLDTPDQQSGVTPIHLAALWGDVEVLERLLKAGCNPSPKDHKGQTPLHKAAQAKDPKCIAALIEAGVQIEMRDAKGNTELHNLFFAPEITVGGIERRVPRAHDWKGALEALLDAGADLSEKDNAGLVVLMHAIVYRQPEVAQELVRRGADVGERFTVRRVTPLELAQAFGISLDTVVTSSHS